MKRRPPPRQPKLADFEQEKQVATGDPTIWNLLKNWQAKRWVSVKPEAQQVALVRLTDAGREEVARERKAA